VIKNLKAAQSPPCVNFRIAPCLSRAVPLDISRHTIFVIVETDSGRFPVFIHSILALCKCRWLARLVPSGQKPRFDSRGRWWAACQEGPFYTQKNIGDILTARGFHWATQLDRRVVWKIRKTKYFGLVGQLPDWPEPQLVGLSQELVKLPNTLFDLFFHVPLAPKCRWLVMVPLAKYSNPVRGELLSSR